MGLSGVGTPDATYAVSCYPAESTILNPNADQPWTRSRRLPLTPRQGDKDTCYSYTIRRGDTLAAVVDHFGLDVRQVSARVTADQDNSNAVAELKSLQFLQAADFGSCSSDTRMQLSS
jgi:cell envelope opacity-associated protein A